MIILTFFSTFYKQIIDVFCDDGEFVDISNGEMSLEEIIRIAVPKAKEKEFISENGKPSLVMDEPNLFYSKRQDKKIWKLYFSQYFTEEELEKDFKDSNIKSVTFARIDIDDKTGNILFADWIRPHFNEK